MIGLYGFIFIIRLGYSRKKTISNIVLESNGNLLTLVAYMCFKNINDNMLQHN